MSVHTYNVLWRVHFRQRKQNTQKNKKQNKTVWLNLNDTIDVNFSGSLINLLRSGCSRGGIPCFNNNDGKRNELRNFCGQSLVSCVGSTGRITNMVNNKLNSLASLSNTLIPRIKARQSKYQFNLNKMNHSEISSLTIGKSIENVKSIKNIKRVAENTMLTTRDTSTLQRQVNNLIKLEKMITKSAKKVKLESQLSQLSQLQAQTQLDFGPCSVPMSMSPSSTITTTSSTTATSTSTPSRSVARLQLPPLISQISQISQMSRISRISQIPRIPVLGEEQGMQHVESMERVPGMEIGMGMGLAREALPTITPPLISASASASTSVPAPPFSTMQIPSIVTTTTRGNASQQIVLVLNGFNNVNTLNQYQ